MLGLLFLYSSLHAALSMSQQQARRLLLASVLYLPAVVYLGGFEQVSPDYQPEEMNNGRVLSVIIWILTAAHVSDYVYR